MGTTALCDTGMNAYQQMFLTSTVRLSRRKTPLTLRPCDHSGLFSGALNVDIEKFQVVPRYQKNKGFFLQIIVIKACITAFHGGYP